MSNIAPSTSIAADFGSAIPVFRIRDLQASISYYVNALGFKVNWQYADFFASVSRDRCNIFLSVGDQGHPGAWTWIGVADAEALYQHYRQTGAKIRHPPSNYEWAYEMQVEDLDGNVLRLGSDPFPDRPLGDWLDMHGQLWRREPSGGLSKVETSIAPATEPSQ